MANFIQFTQKVYRHSESRWADGQLVVDADKITGLAESEPVDGEDHFLLYVGNHTFCISDTIPQFLLKIANEKNK